MASTIPVNCALDAKGVRLKTRPVEPDSSRPKVNFISLMHCRSLGLRHRRQGWQALLEEIMHSDSRQ